jgi:hypothetical protein
MRLGGVGLTRGRCYYRTGKQAEFGEHVRRANISVDVDRKLLVTSSSISFPYHILIFMFLKSARSDNELPQNKHW